MLPLVCWPRGIAHEVGNPLAGISSLVQLLNRHNNDEYTNKRLDEVDAQLRRIQRILRRADRFQPPRRLQSGTAATSMK